MSDKKQNKTTSSNAANKTKQVTKASKKAVKKTANKASPKIEETIEVKVKKKTAQKAETAKKAKPVAKTVKAKPAVKADQKADQSNEKEASVVSGSGIRKPHEIIKDLESADAGHDSDALRYGFAELQASLALESKETTETYNDFLKKVFYVATVALAIGLLNLFLLMAGGCAKSEYQSELRKMKKTNSTHKEQTEIFTDLLKFHSSKLSEIDE